VKESGQAMAAKLRMTPSSGNVFRDIGFPEGEAENLLLRSELMSQVREVARGYSQQEAAKMLGITQPRLNQLLNGKISLFGLDALVNMLAKAKMRVSIKVKKGA
jgi:predicted XRE-type DNA-binding protein